jgi:uncharacterized protein (DUF488 family)
MAGRNAPGVRPGFSIVDQCYAWLKPIMSTVYTIGHSNHSWEAFAELLKEHRIEVAVDTRSAPYSRFAPQFDCEILKGKLAECGVKHLFLGAELGGRPKSPEYYDSRGHVLYGRMKADPVFTAGIERLERGIAEFRVALLCGEENPAHCHRRLLVGRVLAERGQELLHIRADGRLQSEAQVTAESGKPLVSGQPALFAELDEDQWRSTASVSPKRAPANSSAY